SIQHFVAVDVQTYPIVGTGCEPIRPRAGEVHAPGPAGRESRSRQSTGTAGASLIAPVKTQSGGAIIPYQHRTTRQDRVIEILAFPVVRSHGRSTTLHRASE